MEIRSLPFAPAQVAALKSNSTVPAFQPAHDTVSIRFGKTEKPKATTKAEKTQVDKPEDFLQTLRSKGVLISGGGGVMGSGIAMNHMSTGIPASLHDVKDTFVQGGVDKIETSLSEAQKRGLMSGEQAAEVRGKLSGTYTNDTIADIPKDTAFVIEAIFENADAKKALFQKLDDQLDDNAILATNTSSLSVDELAQSTKRPDRFIGLHFFNPPHKNRFIEIVPGKLTSPETVEKTKVLVRALGKVPIVCNDSPGFVVNRMLVPMMNEGIKIFDEWVAAETQAYEKKYGEAPPASVRERIETIAATTVEQAAREVMWPTYNQKPEAAGMLLGPFSGLNRPEYMGLIGEISQVFENALGEGYKPADTVLKKAEAFHALNRRDADFAEKFDALKFKMGGPESIDAKRLATSRDRLQGLMIGVATQLIDEGVTTPEDVNRGVMLGTKWEVSPFELINELGTDKALALVEGYAKTNPAFKVSDALKALAAKGKQFPINYVQSRKEGSTQVITINKPQRYNALDSEMLTNLRSAFREAEKDKSVKTIVFESIGGKHFVSGADLPALQAGVSDVAGKYRDTHLPKPLSKAAQSNAVRRFAYKFVKQGYDLMNEINNSKKVTVAKVNGTALGGGSELALACDYVVAADEARFGFPEEKYGIYPAWGGTEFAKSRVGTALATFLVHEGGLMDDKSQGAAILSARDALDIGLIDRIVPAAELDSAVNAAVASGEFAEKRDRKLGSEMDAVAEARVTPQKNARLAQKFCDYKNRFMADLMQEELKPFYRPEPLQSKLTEVETSLKTARKQLSEASEGDKSTHQATINTLSDQREALLAQSRKLEALYKKIVELADRRVRDDSQPNRMQQWRDINRMLVNMQALQQLQKAAARKEKAE